MTRVASFASQQLMVNRMLEVQRRTQDTQVQISTEKKSQTYSGISGESLRLINFENTRDNAQRHIDNNVSAELRLKTEEVSITTIKDRVRDVRSALLNFNQLDLRTLNAGKNGQIRELQEMAFNTLKDVESLLNVRLEGRYLFSGGAVNTRPVTLGYESLEAFQTAYPGTNGASFPVTRAQQMGNTTLTAAGYGTLDFAAIDATTGTITATPPSVSHGGLTLDAVQKTITATTAGAFNSVAIGSKITLGGAGGATPLVSGDVSFDATQGTITLDDISGLVDANVQVGSEIIIAGTNNGNDNTYTIAAKYNNVLTVTPPPGADEGPTSAPSVSRLNDGTYTLTGKSADGTTLTVDPPPAVNEATDVTPTVQQNVFAHLPVGSTFTMADSAAGPNDGKTFTITGNTGLELTVSNTGGVTAEGPMATATLSATVPNSYYEGDQPGHPSV